MNRIIVLVLSFIAFKAGACSFAPALEEFIITERSPVAATKPNFSVDSIKRGTNDGNRNSCSDAGFINLKLDSASSNDQGYIFKIVEGKFEYQIFDESPVVPTKFMESKKGYSFLWFDGHKAEQAPINITVQIIAISRSGNKSEPQLLTITYP
tara:strand:+ start:51718 stop:52176 length:459 start_codon:yes stop_codon:yes gene_type:complete